MEKHIIGKMESVTHLEQMDCIIRIYSYRRGHIMRLAGTDECGGSI